MSDRMLKCSRCKEVKPEEDFAKQTWAQTGRQQYCKQCKSNYYQEVMKPKRAKLRIRRQENNERI
jgi:hypothetical protein